MDSGVSAARDSVAEATAASNREVGRILSTQVGTTYGGPRRLLRFTPGTFLRKAKPTRIVWHGAKGRGMRGLTLIYIIIFADKGPITSRHYLSRTSRRPSLECLQRFSSSLISLYFEGSVRFYQNHGPYAAFAGGRMRAEMSSPIRLVADQLS